MLCHLRQRLSRGRLSRRVALNSAWLLADRVVRLGIGVVVGAWVARYLGPIAFGKLAYATAIAGLFVAISELSLESITVRALVARPEATPRLLGSALVMRFWGGLAGVALSCITGWLLRADDVLILIMVALVASTFLVTPLNVAEFIFQARLENRVPVAARFAAFIVTNVLRIALVLGGASVVAFAVVPLVECVLGVIALAAFLRGAGLSVWSWRFDREEAVELARQATPLIAAGFAALMVLRLDQLLIGQILGDKAVGIYAAAARLTEAAQFALAGLAIPLLPAMLALRAHDPARYRLESERLFTILLGVGIAAAIVVSLAAPAIVRLLYGPDYEETIGVLRIHAWSLAFGAVGVAVGSYLIAEGLTWFALFRAGGALLVNVALNVVLLPRLGVEGAAWAALGASAAALLLLLLPVRTRTLGRMLASASVGGWWFRQKNT